MRSSCADGQNRRRLLPWSYATFRGCVKCPSARIRLSAPTEPGPEGPPGGLPTSAATAPRLIDAADPSWTFAPLRSLTETDLCEASRRRTPLQGSPPYSTFGSGKRLTRGCLPRLRCAFRVSTLLTPCSSRNLTAVFQTVALMGFRPFEGFPFRGIGLPSGRPGPPGVGSNGRAAR
jgi:hypothetical protein